MLSEISLLKKEKKFILFLFVLAFVIRILFFELFLGQDKNYITADSSAYHKVALQISRGNGISDSMASPQFYRLPGYPIFLSIFYKIFDFDEKMALRFQILLSSLIPILIFYLSLVLFPANILCARIASIYSVFHLGFTVFSGLMMTETLFVLFFLLFLIFFLSSFTLFFCKKLSFKIEWTKFFLSGFFLGCASMIRPLGHYLIFLSFLFLIFSNYRFLGKIKAFICFFIGWLLVVVFWLVRNYFLTGCIFFNTLPGDHFLTYSAAYVIMNSKNISYRQAKDIILSDYNKRIYKEELDKKRALVPPEKCSIKEKLAFYYIGKNPILFVRHSCINILKTFLNPFSEEIFFIYEKKGVSFGSGNKALWDKLKKIFWPLSKRWFLPLVYLEIIFYLIFLFGFFAFSLKAIFIKEYLCVLLKTLPIIGFMIFITLAAGFARLRLPIEPLIMVLSSFWWANFFRKKWSFL